MTRQRVSVPEYRTRIRPSAPSSFSAARMADWIPGAFSSGGLRATLTLISTWGNFAKDACDSF